MIAAAAKWGLGSTDAATEWLAKSQRDLTERALADAYLKLCTEMASGRAFPRPLVTWCEIARRMRNEPAPVARTSAPSYRKPGSPPPPEPGSWAAPLPGETEAQRQHRLNVGPRVWDELQAKLAAKKAREAGNA